MGATRKAVIAAIAKVESTGRAIHRTIAAKTTMTDGDGGLGLWAPRRGRRFRLLDGLPVRRFLHV